MTLDDALDDAPDDAPDDNRPDKTTKSTALILPEFAPVPRAKDRTNGWKPEVQRTFIEALAETGSVKSAARRVGRAEVGAYLLRRHPEAAEFRAAWDIALDIGMRRIEDVAMDRALHGHEQPVYSYGKLIGSRTVYNDRLLMFMLRNRAPDRFAGGLNRSTGAAAMNAVDKMELTRLKAQWRREWAAEHERGSFAARVADAAAQGTALIDRFEAMHRRWFLGFGPQTRAAYRAFRTTEAAEDRASFDRRYADIGAEDAREALAAAEHPDDAEDARTALSEAQAHLAAQHADQQAAEAEYADWYTQERRAKVWLAIDVVFGAGGGEDADDEEESG